MLLREVTSSEESRFKGTEVEVRAGKANNGKAAGNEEATGEMV